MFYVIVPITLGRLDALLVDNTLFIEKALPQAEAVYAIKLAISKQLLHRKAPECINICFVKRCGIQYTMRITTTSHQNMDGPKKEPTK